MGLGADLELQTQPGSLAFVRPAFFAELAWGRDAGAGFWTLAVRAALPGHDAPAAPDEQEASLSALGFDGAQQLTVWQTLGQLAVTAQLAAGVSYLELEARDLDGELLGTDAQLSPLFAAGVGFRYSVLFGFALSVCAEALAEADESSGQPAADSGSSARAAAERGGTGRARGCVLAGWRLRPGARQLSRGGRPAWTHRRSRLARARPQ